MIFSIFLKTNQCKFSLRKCSVELFQWVKKFKQSGNNKVPKIQNWLLKLTGGYKLLSLVGGNLILHGLVQVVTAQWLQKVKLDIVAFGIIQTYQVQLQCYRNNIEK